MVFHFAAVYSIFCLVQILTTAEPLRGHNIVDAGKYDYPFIASLGLKSPILAPDKTHFCTGVLVTKRHVLTAAHCFVDIEPEDVHVVVGDGDLWSGIPYNVEEWTTFEEWASIFCMKADDGDDIAMVLLSRPVRDVNIAPIELTNSRNTELYGTSAKMLGYGLTNEGVFPRHLKTANVEILTKDECKRRYELLTNESNPFEDVYLCSAANPYTSMTKGDSGGPLVDENNVLVGITIAVSPSLSDFGSNPLYNDNSVNLHMSIHVYRPFIIANTKL